MFNARNRAALKEIADGVHLPYLAQIDDDTLLTRTGQMKVDRANCVEPQAVELDDLHSVDACQ